MQGPMKRKGPRQERVHPHWMEARRAPLRAWTGRSPSARQHRPAGRAAG